MLLSVVIVNYKVPKLAIEAVRSVLGALKLIDGDGEVIILDNASGDDSMARLREPFATCPEVHLISSPTNIGFARGNNQAIAQAHGEYLLLLNPDTLLGESTLSQCLAFLQDHPHAGAVGPRLINQHGDMHPESKRGVPTLWHSFCRLAHLYRLAPRSAWFNGYYQGHLSGDEVQQVPILTGAFLMMRRELYLRLGGLDERYFMYGEDIDLCYTLEQAGYHNYFLPTPVLHYKGESEQAAQRVHYEESFYGAMRLFYLKHRRSGCWARLAAPCVLLAIKLQRCLAHYRHVEVGTTDPLGEVPQIALTLTEFAATPDAYPKGSHLQILLAGASYDLLLATMEQCAGRHYFFTIQS